MQMITAQESHNTINNRDKVSVQHQQITQHQLSMIKLALYMSSLT